MVDWVWAFLILAGVVAAGVAGNVQAVTDATTLAAEEAVAYTLQFMGVITFWLGLAKVGERSGLIDLLARLMRPATSFLFPSLPRNHPALGAIMMNFSANVLGLGSAATPFGLKAMQELQKLNNRPEVATDAMCTFLAINTSSITLIPAVVIGLRVSAGSANPTEIVGTTLVATTISTLVAVAADYFCRVILPWNRTRG